MDNIVVKKVNLLKSSPINNPLYSCDNFMVNVKLDDNSLCELSLKDYLLSILFEKYNVNYNVELLKCICILYNTYAYRCMSNDKVIIGSNYFSLYKPLKYYKDIYSNYDELTNYFYSIIKEVDCMFLSYNNQFILPFIHYSNSGKTLSNPKYPYLSSVSSIWDILSKDFITVKEYTYSKFNDLLNINISNKSSFTFINQNNTKKLKIDNKIFSLEELKNLLNLNSCEFNFIINKDIIKVITKGQGNFLGLSLYGGNEIAKNGSKYNSILKYYFPKAKLLRYIK